MFILIYKWVSLYSNIKFNKLFIFSLVLFIKYGIKANIIAKKRSWDLKNFFFPTTWLSSGWFFFPLYIHYQYLLAPFQWFVINTVSSSMCAVTFSAGQWNFMAIRPWTHQPKPLPAPTRVSMNLSLPRSWASNDVSFTSATAPVLHASNDMSSIANSAVAFSWFGSVRSTLCSSGLLLSRPVFF